MSIVKDLTLAESGRMKIEWVKDFMPALGAIAGRMAREQSLRGRKITMSIHMEAKTAYLAVCLKAAGAEVWATGCNPLSTQDDVAAGLASLGVETFAIHGVSAEEYRALRDTYDPAKMYWTSNEVMALTQGYFNIMAPTVKAAVEKSEANSQQLINASAGLSKEQFAEALRDNALKIFEDWKQLSVELLMIFKSDVGIEYQRQPKPDTPTEY